MTRCLIPGCHTSTNYKKAVLCHLHWKQVPDKYKDSAFRKGFASLSMRGPEYKRERSEFIAKLTRVNVPQPTEKSIEENEVHLSPQLA